MPANTDHTHMQQELTNFFMQPGNPINELFTKAIHGINQKEERNEIFENIKDTLNLLLQQQIETNAKILDLSKKEEENKKILEKINLNSNQKEPKNEPIVLKPKTQKLCAALQKLPKSFLHKYTEKLDDEEILALIQFLDKIHEQLLNAAKDTKPASFFNIFDSILDPQKKSEIGNITKYGLHSATISLTEKMLCSSAIGIINLAAAGTATALFISGPLGQIIVGVALFTIVTALILKQVSSHCGWMANTKKTLSKITDIKDEQLEFKKINFFKDEVTSPEVRKMFNNISNFLIKTLETEDSAANSNVNFENLNKVGHLSSISKETSKNQINKPADLYKKELTKLKIMKSEIQEKYGLFGLKQEKQSSLNIYRF